MSEQCTGIARRRRLPLALLILFVVGLAACSQAANIATSEAPVAIEPVLAEVVGEETVTLKVASFNVLYGAGFDRRYDMNIPDRFKGRDRLPDLVAFLRQVDADVVAMQESAGLDVGSPSIADQLATTLGMTYVIAHDAWDLHVILFSKFPIVQADYVSRDQDFNGVALRATLRVTPTAEVNLLAVHLNSMSSATRACQVDALIDIAATGRQSPTIIAGDMNFRPTAAQFQQLSSRGWRLVVAQPTWPIDQIWIDATTDFTSGDWWQAFTPPQDISDHLPVGVELTLTLPSRSYGKAPSKVEAGTLQYVCALPTPQP